MTALMVLELEVGFKVDAVIRALEKCDISLAVEDDCITGWLNDSGAEVVFKFYQDDVAISAEGVVASWRVGALGAFHCRYSRLQETWRDIEKIMLDLDSQGCGKFVLSFQYESIYALKDENGYRVLQSMVV